jgi:hypothetical protein
VQMFQKSMFWLNSSCSHCDDPKVVDPARALLAIAVLKKVLWAVSPGFSSEFDKG